MKEIAYASARRGYFGAVTLFGVLAFLRVAVMAGRARDWSNWLDLGAMTVAIILIWISSLRHLKALNGLDGRLENKVLVGLSTDAFRMTFFAYMLLFIALRALR